MNEEEVYKPLRDATPKELLEAAIWFWLHTADDHTPLIAGLLVGFAIANRKGGSDFLYGLKEGFAIAQKDGWEHVAPAWLREVLCHSIES